MKALLQPPSQLFLPLFAAACILAEPASASPLPLTTLEKPRIKVLVTDSGLGGLSVCGDLEKKALERKSFRSVDITFCNALPEANVGYNNLATAGQKARVFSGALLGMVKAYDPDVILIACNTLSVVYPDTDASHTLKVPVVGIVGLGVDMIVERLARQPASCAVVFGTETTISANAHRAACLVRGIAGTRLITQPCADLAAEIQTSPAGEPAKNLIGLYVEEAVGHIPKGSQRVIAALCCTHYGYCKDQFEQAFATAGYANVEIVNPNEKMADLLFPPALKDRFPTSGVSARVVSRALLSPEEISAISALLEKDSPRTAAALRRYERKPDLFPFRRD